MRGQNPNNNRVTGWRQYFPLALLVALIGYAVSNGSTIASFYADPIVATIIGGVGAALVTVYFVYVSKTMAREGESLEREITSEATRTGQDLVAQKIELGSFGQLNKLAYANIASNAVSTFAVLARLLPSMQPNAQSEYSEAQKAGLVAITALSTATLLLNFSYLTVVGGRNGALTMRRNDLNSQPTLQALSEQVEAEAAQDVPPPASLR